MENDGRKSCFAILIKNKPIIKLDTQYLPMLHGLKDIPTYEIGIHIVIP